MTTGQVSGERQTKKEKMMAENPYSPNYGLGYTPNTQTQPSKKLIFIALAVLFVLIVVGLVFLANHQTQQDKYIKSATAAARKSIPNAQVSDLKVADGFALAIVNDPTASGQGFAGNTTIFKVKKDGSMIQLANGSSFSPIDLLGYGIPLATQAKLTGDSLTQTQQALAATCGYDGGGAPGFMGFNGSFDPNGWQIDALTLDGIKRALSATISANNPESNPDKNVVCVSANRKNSSRAIDLKTYVSTFGLDVEFISSNGTITPHKFTFSVGPMHSQSYTLDGASLAGN